MAGMSDIAFFKADASDRLFAERINGAADQRLAAVL